MDMIKVFGSNVRKYRLQLGISQEKFAERCGLHRTYISDIECFRRSISLENIQRIAEALEVETYKLFVDEEVHNHAEKQ
ncbi:MAG: helix-turn-helix domain-containing protein [Clostridiales bacterium]|nr:helix-turn-helix domain-containing protein [Clostridiales bacterium]